MAGRVNRLDPGAAQNNGGILPVGAVNVEVLKPAAGDVNQILSLL